jgi:hypothetical protein
VGCLDVASTHGPSARSIYFQSQRSYRPAEGRVEAKRRQRPGPPPATTNRLLAKPGGGPCVNCNWVEVSRGRFVGGRIVKAPDSGAPGLIFFGTILSILSIICTVLSVHMYCMTCNKERAYFLWNVQHVLYILCHLCLLVMHNSSSPAPLYPLASSIPASSPWG